MQWFPAGASRAEETFFRLLLALVVILAAARLIVPLVRKIGQTDVIGEVLAGLLLGPSLLGALAPGLPAKVFTPDILPMLGAISSLGLVFLMFQLGQEFEFKTNLGSARRAVLFVSIAGTAVPFLLGYLVAPWFLAQVDDPVANPEGFRLFFAIAMSVTAIPVLGRIFLELGLTHTRAATVAIACAAVSDVTGWLLLGGVSLSVTTALTAGWVLGSIGALLLFVVTVFFVVRPLLRRYIGTHLRRHGQLRHTAIGVLLAIAFLAAGATSLIGVHALLGGFALGIALHDQRRFVSEWKMRVAPLVNTFFLPIFFTFTGLRTDVTALGNPRDLLLCLLILAVAIAGKFGGCFLAARVAGESNRQALTLGVCMNTRGLVELVVLNVGYELGLIPDSIFTMLVIMAVVTTMMATPLIRLLLKSELSPSRGSFGTGIVELEFPATSSWEQRERARQGLREMLEGLLTDRAAASRVVGIVNELLETVVEVTAPWSTRSPRIRLEIEEGRALARVSVEVGPEAPTIAANVERLIQRPAAAPTSPADGNDVAARRFAALDSSQGCRIALSASESALSVEAEFGVRAPDA